jgi:hypothetical protein
MIYVSEANGPPLGSPEAAASVISALQLRNLALETAATQIHDGLMVTPEGVFAICGRRCTLNEAIMYLGNRAVTRAKAAA